MTNDILILSNGPGEVMTWVLPVVKALRQELGNDRKQVRISVVLSPCPHASGKEAAIVASFPEVDRVQSAEHFFPFLFWGKTINNWDWRSSGVVLFLGGDQFFPLVIGTRLGYKTLVYAEWEARWYRWIDCFAVTNHSVLAKIPQKYHHKFTVVGDLMTDLAQEKPPESQQDDLIGLLPGSKAAKLTQGVPLSLAIASHLYQKRPSTRFVIPVAPTLDLETLAQFADSQYNPMITKIGSGSAKLVKSNPPFLETASGVRIELATQFPAYELLCQCRLCLTTVGANTAQLAALGIPMIVLLPTQELDAMRSWDGLPGILANLPLFGSLFAKVTNWLVLKQGRLFAWPNIWAQGQIVPELVGQLQAAEIAEMVLDFLDNPEKLTTMRHDLLSIREVKDSARQIALCVSSQLI